MSALTLTVLGCGSSSGSPVIGCDCAVCQSDNPKNRRSRCSAWIEVAGKHFIIDTGTDFRQQALREKIPAVDAVLYTHPHSDHINGIDDLRAYCFRKKQAIDIYGNSFTMENAQSRFEYAFMPPCKHWNRPVLVPHILDGHGKTADIHGVSVQYFALPHGRWQVLGYKIGNIAWLTDISDIDETTIAALQGVEYLFIDCLMMEKYPSHLSFELAVDFSKKINAKQTYLIHTTHKLDFDAINAKCPPNVAMAYDGLKVTTEC
ncbi:MAG: MBL fold metallo-hydrolase [Neisseriaceae bacterium]|nr:MBL fold metallo-hydrolase [Neisseriaceae bacterium]